MKKNEVGNIVGTLEESGNVNSLMMDASNSSMLSRLAPIDQKKFKKLKANHEHKVRKKNKILLNHAFYISIEFLLGCNC